MTTTNIAELRAQSRSRSALDFPGTIRAHYPYWDAQYRPYLLMAVDALPAEHFGYKPRPDMLTAHQTIVHIAEAEHSWIHGVVGGNGFEEWVVEMEDPSLGYKTLIDAPDHAALHALLAKSHRLVQSYFDRPVADLAQVTRWTPRDGIERTYKLHWILDHVQEHEIHHRAQLNMYLRMLGITPPSI